MEESNNLKETPVKNAEQKSPKQGSVIRLWMMLILMYFILFSSIGYVAFWEQDFNDPDKFLVKYEKLREKHFQVIKEAYGEQGLAKGDEEFNTFINDYMKSANNTAGDLQELATQSFNIVLGAFLAFLSATATMVFQGNIRSPAGSKG